MSKAVALNWNEFMNGNVVRKKPHILQKGINSSAVFYAVMIPSKALAAGGNHSFDRILETVLQIADYFCVGIIIFVGATWMMNNRSKALEMLIGGSIGYIIIRHARDIQQWLSGI